MKQLNEEETKMIQKIESSSKWDYLTFDISVLAPCVLVTIISLINDSAAGVFSGFLAYAIIKLWASVRQSKTLPIIQSALKKMHQSND